MKAPGLHIPATRAAERQHWHITDGPKLSAISRCAPGARSIPLPVTAPKLAAKEALPGHALHKHEQVLGLEPRRSWDAAHIEAGGGVEGDGLALEGGRGV